MLSMCQNRSLASVGLFASVLVMSWVGVVIAPAHAGNTPSSGSSQRLIVACDKTQEGLVVNFGQSSSLEDLELDPDPGQPCLKFLALFPPRNRSQTPVKFSAHTTGGSEGSSIEQQLIWLRERRGAPTKIIGCALDGQYRRC